MISKTLPHTFEIRNQLIELLEKKEFVEDKTGVKTIEIVGASFVADEPTIFGAVNEDWNRREFEWYKSLSLNVNDIPPPIPQIWKSVASEDGGINSNYGWCIWSAQNSFQYLSCLETLRRDPTSRRACMIYNRPSMQFDFDKDGMSDFMCTYSTQHMIRDGKLVSLVYMRSNDAVFGYKGDFAWQNKIHRMLAESLSIEPGEIIWNAASLHVYERHFGLVCDFNLAK